jgi:hypothetical protein
MPNLPASSDVAHRQALLAPGLTGRAVIEKMTTIQMVDVQPPTTGGRRLILPHDVGPIRCASRFRWAFCPDQGHADRDSTPDLELGKSNADA